MSLTYSNVALPMVGGVDTGSDAKAIAPPKLAVLENGRFNAPRGTISKRNGYTEVASLESTQGVDVALTTARSLAVRGDELVLFDQLGVLGLDEASQRWRRRSEGASNYLGVSMLAPVGITMRQMPKPRQDQTYADRATAFGVVVCAYLADDTRAYLTVVDATTGAVLLQPSKLDTAATRPRVVALGDETVCVMWAVEGTTRLYVTTITRANLARDLYAVASQTHVKHEVISDLNATTPVWDAVAANDEVLFTYNSSTATTVKYGYMLPHGTLDGSLSSQATAAAVSVLTIARETHTGRFALAWAMNAGTVRCDARMFNADKTARFAAATLYSGGGVVYKNICAAFNYSASPDTTTLYVFWEENAAATYNHLVQCNTVDNAGSTSSAWTVYRHSGLASKPWWTGASLSAMDVCVVHDSTLQPTYFMARTTGSTLANTITGRILPGTAGGLITGAHLPSVSDLGNGTFAVALAERNIPDSGTQRYDRGIQDVTIDPAVVGYQTVTVGNVLYVAGGILGAYDGTTGCESGFLLYPENATGVAAATGNMTASSSYSYRIYYEYINGQGQREQSTTAAAVTVATGVGEGNVTLTIPTLAHTMRQLTGALNVNAPYVGFAIYRTTASAAAPLIYYRVSNTDASVNVGDNAFVANTGSSTDTVTFYDNLSDSNLILRETDYLSSDPVELENIAPPAHSLVAAGNNRVYLSGFEDPDLVWASKLRGSGEALAFSDALTISAPAADGPITAIAVLGDELIIFRARHIYSVAGDGPTNTGSNGQWETPRSISDDIGCVDARSLVRFPGGLIFKSRRGLYLLGVDRSLRYVGAEVEAYNAEDVVSAIAMSDTHEVRFLTSSRCMVYDYLLGQWAVWTIAGAHAAQWQGQYVYLPGTSGQTLIETEGHFADVATPFSMLVETPWLRIGSMQGTQHVRRVSVLGDYYSTHRAQVSLSYNYEPFASDIQYWSPAGVLAGELFGAGSALFGADAVFGGNDSSGRPVTGVYQYRLAPARPECQAIKVRIQDIPTAGTQLGEGYSLSEISFDIAPRTGAFKPGADKAAG